MQFTDFPQVDSENQFSDSHNSQTKIKKERKSKKNTEHRCAPNPRLLQQPETVTDKQVSMAEREERERKRDYYLI